MAHVLAIDHGTQSTRAAVLTLDGRMLAHASVPIALIRKGPNWVEQDAEQIVQTLRIAVDDLFAKISKSVRADIECCGIATQRSTVLSWDAGGRALSPALNWQDTRGWEQVQTLRKQAPEIRQISGLPLSAHYGATKLRWLADNYKHDRMVGPISSFLLSRIGNGTSNLVDHGNAQRLQLLDIDTGDWSPRLLELFGIDASALPQCVPIYHRFGELKGHAIPITAMNGDQNAAWFGSGLLNAGTALVNIGSGAFILASRQDQTDPPELLTTISYSTKLDRSYLLEATVNGADNALQWLINQFGIKQHHQLLAQSLEQIMDPPIFLNTVGDLGSPWWRSGLDPVFNGDPSAYSHAEMLASVCESILFLIYYNIQLIQQSQPISELRLSGGLSRVDLLCQKLANLTNLEVRRSNDPESTIRGIAWIAAGQPDTWRIPEQDMFTPKKEPGLNSRFKLFIELLTKRIEGNDDE